MEDATDLSAPLELARSVLRAHGLPFTMQRRAVLEALVRRADHPTADALFNDLRTSHPGVSRTTVYRILETLSRFGLVRRLSHAGGSVRWDHHMQRHHHVECVSCDRVVDFEDADLDRLGLPAALPRGFEVRDFSVHFSGLCPSCKETSEVPPKRSNQARLSPLESGAPREAEVRTRRARSE